MKLKLLDLFSGIGGFSLGLESTGYFKTIAFVEKDKFCQQVLQKNFKDTPIESEVRNVKGERYAADIITGGFPCQPFSVAGKRRGTDDDRYLWDETIRIIRECKPRWFIGENVEGIINIQGGVVLRQVQDDLEKEGFQVQCLVIPASGIGAWHQRKRVWIIAYSNSNGLYRQKNNETIKSSNQSKEWVSIGDDKDVSNSNSRRSIGKNEEIQTRGDTINNGSKDVPNSKRNEHQHSTTRSGRTNKLWGFYSEKEEQTTHDLWSKTTGCDAIHGEDVPNTNRSSKEQYSWWQTQSAFCGVPHGISYELDKGRANRIKSLGNSIVPLIARELGIAIMKAEQDG
jgi:DNA (cytosine-5)-methyltransferase 1